MPTNREKRAQAKAAIDRREQQVRPSDRTGFYLRQLQTVLSHLVDVAAGIGSARGHFNFAGWDLIAYSDIAIERADEGNDLPRQDEQWQQVWESLKKAVLDLRRWDGNGQIAGQLAKVVFVAAFVLRRAYETSLECGLSGEERGFELCAPELPVPLDSMLPLTEQMDVIWQNLQWFHEHMRSDIVRPRWW